MLWFIIHSNGTRLQYILQNEEYVVGRKECNVLLEDDKSISRKHAILKINRADELIVRDCKSKYGTFINDAQIAPNIDAVLNINCVVKFGLLNSWFRVNRIDFNIVYTSLSNAHVKLLQNFVRSVGGVLSNHWSPNCTHLAVKSKLILTNKTCCCIVKGQSIVQWTYWLDVFAATENNLKLPERSDYFPTLSELLVNENVNVAYDPVRETLFTDKTFVFATRAQMKIMETLITVCGGGCISWDSGTLRQTDISKNISKYIFVKTMDGNQSNVNYNCMIEYLNSIELRPVLQTEIARAIIHCSLSEFCNPKHKPIDNLLPRSTQFIGMGRILVSETQNEQGGETPQVSSLSTQDTANPKIIPETENSEQFIPETVLSNLDISNLSIATHPETQDNISPERPTLTDRNKGCDLIERLETLPEDAESIIDASQEDLMNVPIQITNTWLSKSVFESKKRPADNYQVTMDSFVSTKKRTKPATTERNSSIVSNPFSFKRKATENTAFENVTKKPNRNCFVEKFQMKIIAVAGATTSSDNLKSPKWLSKSVALQDQQTINETSANISNVVDEELQKYIDAFKDCVKIITFDADELVAMKNRTAATNSYVTELGNNSTRTIKNFKRFRRTPRMPKANILPSTEFVVVTCCDNNNGPNFAAPKESEDEEEEQIQASTSKPVKEKKYMF